jgi:hypothetical protein
MVAKAKTKLFTDVVGCTERASGLRDEAWATALRAPTFDGLARAITAALRNRKGVPDA